MSETTQGREVVIVSHSCSGYVGDSSTKYLVPRKKKDHSTSQNSPGHVVGFINIATSFAVTRLNLVPGAGGSTPIWKMDDESGFLVIRAYPREMFYHDLPADEGNEWDQKLERQSVKGLAEGDELAYAGWKDVPVWYLATTEDKSYPIQAQRVLWQKSMDEGGDITVREIHSSHSPMSSRPKETSEFILEAVVNFAR